MVKLLSKIKILIYLGILLIPTLAHAQVSLDAQVDRTEVRMGESIELKVTVHGARSSSEPQIPKINAFNMTYHGQSSQFNMVNSKITSSVTYTYSIFPRNEGQFTLGPVRLDHKGKILSSKPIKIKVLPADAKMKGAEPLILQATVSKPSAYYNEQIIYTLELARRVEVLNARLELPDFKGFWVEDLGKQRDFTRAINGHTYAITQIKKALFPNKTGTLKIGPSAIHCEVVLPRRRDKRTARDPFLERFFQDSFLSLRQRTVSKLVRSPELTVEAKPLPAKGQPDNFYALVGKVKIESELSKKRVETGDSSTLTITVSGNANIRDAQLVEPEKIEGFKVYDDKPNMEFVPRANHLEGKKIFKKALVPLEAGKTQTPVYKIPYFDPESKSYKVTSTKPISLLVRGAAEKEKLNILGAVPGVAPKKAIKILGKDILTVYTHLNALEDERISPAENVLYIVFFLLPPGIFLGLMSFRKRSQLYQRNTAIMRKKKALKSAQKKLKTVSTTNNVGDLYPQISKIIKEYLGDKLNLSGGALTPQEIQAKLQSAGLEETCVNEVTELMEQCDFCQFAPSENGQGNCQHLFAQTQELLTKLEKKI